MFVWELSSYRAIGLSLREISYIVRANNAKNVRCRDAQCNTEESP